MNTPLPSRVMESEEMLMHLRDLLGYARQERDDQTNRFERATALGELVIASAAKSNAIDWSNQVAALEQAIKCFEVLTSNNVWEMEIDSDGGSISALVWEAASTAYVQIAAPNAVLALLKAHGTLYSKSTPLPQEGDTPDAL